MTQPVRLMIVSVRILEIGLYHAPLPVALAEQSILAPEPDGVFQVFDRPSGPAVPERRRGRLFIAAPAFLVFVVPRADGGGVADSGGRQRPDRLRLAEALLAQSAAAGAVEARAGAATDRRPRTP